MIAGGTHVMPRIGHTAELVSLRRVGLRGITQADGVVTIGAATTLAQVGREVEFLRDAIESIASPTIRNMATVGGNLFVPQPHGDLAVCLLALDAKVTIVDGERIARGRRVRGVRPRHRDPLQGARAVVLHEGDAPPPELRVDRHRRVRRRPDRARRRRPARLSARTPPRRRSPAPSTASTSQAAAAAAVEAAEPFDDAFASAWYRRRVLPVHVRRALLGE